MGALEDGEDVGGAGVIAPERIGAGDVGQERAVGRGGGGRGIKLEGKVIRVEAGGTEGDKRAKRVGGDEVVKDRGARFGEVGREIHGRMAEARERSREAK